MICHRSPISGVAAHRDRFVVTAGYDNQLVLWDAATKTALARSLHDHLANQCTISPDGKYAASASSDYSARVWSLPDLRLHAVCAEHEDDVEMVAFHPSLPLLATASRDHRVRIFGLDGRLRRVLSGHSADVISVEWVRGTSILISSSDDGTVRRWDAESGALLENVDMRGVETDTIAVSPAGLIFAGNDRGEIAVIDGKNIRTIPAHDAGIKRLVLDPAGERLLSISYDRRFELWRILGGGGLEMSSSAALPDVIWPRSVAFLGAERMVFGTFGTSYATFELRTGRMDTSGVEPTWGLNAVTVLRGDRYSVGDAGVVFKNGSRHRELGSLCNFLTPFGGMILTGGQAGILFDAVSGRALHQHRSPLNCAAVISGDRAIVGTYTGEGLVFRMCNGALELEQTVELHENAIKGLACSNGQIFSVCATGAAAFHSASSLRPERAIPGAHDKIANGCVALPGGFASVSRDLRLRIWSGSSARVFTTPLTHSIKCIAASESGRFLALGAYDGFVAIFDVAAERWARTARPTAAGISSLCADGEAFLASSYDGNIYRTEPSLPICE